MKKKIVVIGSGFGGLASALRLRSKGYEVTLLEKHSDLGGRARVFKKDGFTYDGGPTVITAPYLFEELFSLFNKKISDYVKIVPLDLWYRFVFHDEPQVLHYGVAGSGLKLKEGLTFTIEPMINQGKRHTRILSDGWTAVTKDRKLSAQWEHTILVTPTGYEILTHREWDETFPRTG